MAGYSSVGKPKIDKSEEMIFLGFHESATLGVGGKNFVVIFMLTTIFAGH